LDVVLNKLKINLPISLKFCISIWIVYVRNKVIITIIVMSGFYSFPFFPLSVTFVDKVV